MKLYLSKSVQITAFRFAFACAGFAAAIPDFSCDGKPNAAILDRYSGNAAILLGGGAGNVGAPQTFCGRARIIVSMLPFGAACCKK